MFNTGLEAAGGALILLVFPLISVVTIGHQIMSNQPPEFFSFSYPILTISLSDVYDAFGRLGEDIMKNRKVYLRIILSILSFLLALCLTFSDEMTLLHATPILPILLNGLLLFRDMYARWNISVDLMCREMGGVTRNVANANTPETNTADKQNDRRRAMDS